MDQFYNNILLLLSIPIYAILIPFEIILSNFRRRKFYTWRETLMNLYLNAVNTGLDLTLRVLIGLTVLNFFYQYHILTKWNPIIYWILLLFAEDFLFWVEHFVDHRCRLFWAVHVTHHSSPEFNFSTGFRSSVLMPAYKYFYFIPLALIGFKPLDAIFMYSLTQIYGILIHTQHIKKMPRWVEYFFVTPSHHRVHHASNIPYLDKNLGMTFIIWDRMFGTFAEEQPDHVTNYGITKPIEKPNHPIHIITHEWKEIAKDLRKSTYIKDKLKYLFNPPGWSHDGRSKTTKELQKELIASKSHIQSGYKG